MFIYRRNQNQIIKHIDNYLYVEYNAYIDNCLCMHIITEVLILKNDYKNYAFFMKALSDHMKTLCESDLVISRKDGIMTKYSIGKNSLEDLRMFIDTIDDNMSAIA